MFGKTITDLQTEASIRRLEETRQKIVNPALSLSAEHRHLLEEHRRLNETGIFADIRRARENYETAERNQVGLIPNHARALVKEYERLQKTESFGSSRRTAEISRHIGLIPDPVKQIERLHRELQDSGFGRITSFEGRRLIGEMKALLEDKRALA